MLVENWCFRKSNDFFGVCGHFSAIVKLLIPGGGQQLWTSGLHPQDQGHASIQNSFALLLMPHQKSRDSKWVSPNQAMYAMIADLISYE